MSAKRINPIEESENTEEINNSSNSSENTEEKVEAKSKKTKEKIQEASKSETAPPVKTGKKISVTAIGHGEDETEAEAAPEPADEPDIKEPEETPEEEDKSLLEEPDDDETAEDAYVDELTADEDETPDTDEADNADEDIAPEPDKEEFSDNKTVDAVDDIVASETNELLAHEDAITEAESEPEPKKSFSQKIKGFFKAWWRNPKARWATFAGFGLALIALTVFPSSRYFILNSAGVRVQSSMRIVDSQTEQPLKNVQVSLQGQTVQTDPEGVANFQELKLGSSQLVIKKRGFAENSKKIVLGFGSNPLGAVGLQATGTKFTITTTDWLSGKPVKKTEATSGDASAYSDEKGVIILSVDKNSDDNISVDISADGYRTETISFPSSEKPEAAVALVYAKKHVLVSKRTGKLDIYKIDVDGKNEELLLAGTGFEREDMTIAPHTKKDLFALVSTRDNDRNEDGFIKAGLFIVETSGATPKKITQSERVQIVDWFDDKLVFVTVSEGKSAADPNRSKLMVYDDQTGITKEITHTNYFNDVLSTKEHVYFAPAGYQSQDTAKLYRINPDGSNQKTIFDKEVWNLYRTAYDTIEFSVNQDWYKLKTTEEKATPINTSPANNTSRLYRDQPGGTKTVWIDNRDGKGVLILQTSTDGKEETLEERGGLRYPLYWLSDKTVIFRLNNGQETADYVRNTEGGEAKKIKDVTDTGGVDTWYYY